MALRGLSLTETTEHISMYDEVQERDQGATVFTLGALDADTRARIGDRAMVMQQGLDGNNMFVNSGTRDLETVRFGLKGWVNFLDKNGVEIVFSKVTMLVNGKSKECVAPECLDALDQPILQELAGRIMELNSVRAEEAKNLEVE